MESHMLLGFVEILTEALKIFCKNWKFVASFTLLTLSLYSILYFFNFFSFKSLFTKWIFNQTFLLVNSLNSPEYANVLVNLHKDVRTVVAKQWIFLLLSSIISFYFSISTILASSASAHAGKILSSTDLLSLTATSTKRPFITLLYITFFSLGYFFVALPFLLPPLLNFQHPFALKAFYILLCFSYLPCYAYLTVVWNLGLVVSVLEENFYGVEALGKAAKIVRGMELHGFLANILITMLCSVVLFRITRFRGITFADFSAVPMMMGLILLNCIWLIRMFGLMAYTVLYCQCKKNHGEEVDLKGAWNLVD